MLQQKAILFTGGSGLLGREFQKYLPDVNYPSSREFDVTDYHQMADYIENKNLEMIIHAAAFTSPPKVDREPLAALSANIIGTACVVKLCIHNNLRLIYISTDYVFRGDQGHYKEFDPVYPVNRYAWSKLGGECAVRMYDNSLIIRTSFGPNVFPYEKAFVDQWTSRESVREIARRIIALLDKEITGTIHVGGERKTVFQYAKSLDESRDIKPLSIKEVEFKVPVDTSLNCEKYHQIMMGKIFSEEDI
jgi:dTDP-4-dehydrorhamnose reductase